MRPGTDAVTLPFEDDDIGTQKLQEDESTGGNVRMEKEQEQM
jgi:hypothetical protein